MDGPRHYDIKCSKSERERQVPHDISHMRNPKYDINELIHETDSKMWGTHLCLPRGMGAGGGMDGEFGISRCKLLYIEWINEKVLLYSTTHYIQ